MLRHDYNHVLMLGTLVQATYKAKTRYKPIFTQQTGNLLTYR